MNRKCLFILAVFFFICPAAAQQLSGPYIAYGPESKYLSAQNFTVFQSRGGYLWIGNQNGLIRFDGKHYKNFFADHTNPNSPTDNSVVDIAEDKNGHLWFCGFSNGLTKYNERTGHFKKYAKPTKDDFQFYGIYGALNDSDDNLWFATAGRGLAQYNFEKDSFTLFYPEPDKCKDGSVRGDNYVTGICEDRQDKNILWITSFKGLYAFNKKSSAFTHYPDKRNPGIFFNSCDAGAGGLLWIATWGSGLLCFNTITKTYSATNTCSTPAIVSHVKVISDSIVFAACFNEGLYQLNTQTGYYTNSTPSVSYNTPLQKMTINKISVTPDAGIFLGGNNYIFQYHPSFSRLKKNVFFEGDAPGEYTGLNSCIWDAASKKYWIATSYGNGLYQLEENGSAAKKIPVDGLTGRSEKIFGSLVKDATNRWWALNYFYGVYILNEQKGRFEKPEKNFTSLPDSLFKNIKSLQTDSSGNIWMLSDGNFIYYHVTTGQYERFPITWDAAYKGPKKFAPALLRLAPDGNAWLLTQNGFFVCNGRTKKVRHIYKTGTVLSSLPSASIEAGTFTVTGQYWINSGGTLHVYDWQHDSVLSSHTINVGLPSSNIKDIQSDPEGKIWVNTLAGLGLFDPSKKLWQTFNRFDGLESDYLDGNLFITNNKIIIEQDNGFVLKDIEQVRSAGSDFRFRFTSIKINDEEWEDTLAAEYCTGLTLPYNQNNISVEFAAMDWLYPFKTTYLYRIDGMQSLKTFSLIEENKINLAGLGPGQYTIHVKALSGSGRWSDEISLPITIQKPFWQTGWFIAACVLAFSLLLYAVYRYRINQMHKLYTMRNNIAQDLHDEIGSTLTSIKILSEVSEKNIVKDAAKTVQFLQKIKEQSAAAQQGISDIVWAVNPGNDKLENMVIHMREYAAQTLELKNIHTQIDIDERVLAKTLNMNQRRDLFLIFREAVNNIVKYAGATSVTVKLERVNNDLLLQVADNGAGFDVSKKHSSNGIKNMQLRAKALNGSFSISSAPAQGTSIRIIFPAT